MQKSETYVGIREAAELLDRSPDTIRRWIKSGKIQASKQGNQYQILSAEIDKLRSKEPMQKTIQEHRQTDGNVEMEIVKLLRERSFISYQEAIDTTTPMDEAMFTIIGAMAKLERDIIVERVKAGMRKAKE